MIESPHKIEIVKLYADQNGESHFTKETLDTTIVSFAPPAPPLHISTPIDAQKIMFLLLPEGWYGDMHPAPHRQFMTLIQGELETMVSDGEIRHFKKGDTVLVEDTFGKGHATKSIDGNAIVAVVQF